MCQACVQRSGAVTSPVFSKHHLNCDNCNPVSVLRWCLPVYQKICRRCNTNHTDWKLIYYSCFCWFTSVSTEYMKTPRLLSHSQNSHIKANHYLFNDSKTYMQYSSQDCCPSAGFLKVETQPRVQLVCWYTKGQCKIALLSLLCMCAKCQKTKSEYTNMAQKLSSYVFWNSKHSPSLKQEARLTHWLGLVSLFTSTHYTTGF